MVARQRCGWCYLVAAVSMSTADQTMTASDKTSMARGRGLYQYILRHGEVLLKGACCFGAVELWVAPRWPCDCNNPLPRLEFMRPGSVLLDHSEPWRQTGLQDSVHVAGRGRKRGCGLDEQAASRQRYGLVTITM